MKQSEPQLIDLQKIDSENGRMVVVEGLINIPFEIKRVFIVEAGNGELRGMHAHRQCSQLLICSHGKVKVNCTNGEWVKSYHLSEPSTALLIPNGIWAEQLYMNTKNLLTVLCDFLYEEADYIRDFEQYLREKNQGENK